MAATDMLEELAARETLEADDGGRRELAFVAATMAVAMRRSVDELLAT